MKYLKVMFKNKSSANKNIEYKVNEINISNNWNPKRTTPEEMGGFNFGEEKSIIRWLIRGDTLYDVKIPEDAEVVKVNNPSTPNGVFRTNKIIIKNPRNITDDIAMSLYKKSNIPEKSYFKAMAGCAIRGYEKTYLEIMKDKVTKENIDLVIDEINNFITPQRSSGTAENGKRLYNDMLNYLNEIKSNLLISRFIDKDPYIKNITNDKIINITGESGSGKSTYTSKYLNNDNYILIDTDLIFNNAPTDNKYIVELRNLFQDKTKEDIISDFDNFYKILINYFKDNDKTIIIDSAQYRNIKDYTLLKGKVIIMRISTETCYNRCLNRWKDKNKNYKEEDFKKYTDKKKNMFKNNKGLNKFIETIDKINIENN